jgi:hypothetical protein
MVMKKIFIMPTAFIILSACSSGNDVSVSSEQPIETIASTITLEITTTTSTTTTTHPPITRPTLPPEPGEPPMNGYQENVYLQMLRDNTPYWYYSYTNENLVGLALAICDELDAGTPVDKQLVNLLVMIQNVDPELGETAGLFMRYVVRYVCPEHYVQIENLNS